VYYAADVPNLEVFTSNPLLPHAIRVSREVLSLPISPSLPRSAKDEIIQACHAFDLALRSSERQW
jgi:dTDP-4-amino-4,6-dideoxygalactose transaminase